MAHHGQRRVGHQFQLEYGRCAEQFERNGDIRREYRFERHQRRHKYGGYRRYHPVQQRGAGLQHRGQFERLVVDRRQWNRQ